MADLIDLSRLQTEGINPKTTDIDQVSTLRMCRIINDEDKEVAFTVTPFLPTIAAAIDALTPRVRRGGRVIYVGAGTSGRLGILDASEIPPTFAAPPSQFVGIIAGGDAAIRQAQEGAEDSISAAESDLQALNLDPELDSLIGIAASGRTPYVLGCLAYAKNLGCVTIGVACASPSSMEKSKTVDFMISPITGPEVVTGSTRLKAGTATKLVLNMLSTGTMIRTGKTYGNMMVDLSASNLKLKQRSRNILRRLSPSCNTMTDAAIDELLASCHGSVKLALMASSSGLSIKDSQDQLDAVGGVLAKALANLRDSAQNKSITAEGRQITSRQFVLCVDAGGSTCRATVRDHYGLIAKGIAGPCSMADHTAEQVVETIFSAVKEAINDYGISAQGDLQEVFKYAWIGIAGSDRNGYREQIIPLISRRLGLAAPEQLRVTNDVDLLAASLSNYKHFEVSSAVVAIAGTGSICMRYNKDTDGLDHARVARSGGWGHRLGDEGSGYALGREAIRHVLSVVDARQLGIEKEDAGPLERAVLEYFGCSSSIVQQADIDLLSAIVTPSDDQTIKKRIAGVARLVLSTASSDIVASSLVESQLRYFVHMSLEPLLHPGSTGYKPPAETLLILSGGMFKNDTYRSAFKDLLERRGIKFAFVQVVDEAEQIGASYLLSLEHQEV